jgi:hypothetical protein
MAKTGYNITRAASNVSSSVSRGFGSFRNRFMGSKTASNAPVNNGTKKNNRPWWRRGLNKVKGAYGTLKNRLFKKKNVPSVGNGVAYNGQGPSAAAAARTRKNRRHH